MHDNCHLQFRQWCNRQQNDPVKQLLGELPMTKYAMKRDREFNVDNVVGHPVPRTVLYEGHGVQSSIVTLKPTAPSSRAAMARRG